MACDELSDDPNGACPCESLLTCWDHDSDGVTLDADCDDDGIPDESVSLLLAHSPEIYRHAAYVGFDVMMCGHTHGGQICLPGGIALTFNSSAPRFTGVGAWSYALMQGYTSAGTGSSVVPARFNCPPEVTLHHLRRPAG